tara:strand:+ start:2091 stop:2534 length:444 start_codon:yes stop_codon:yes gene_type:complete
MITEIQKKPSIICNNYLDWKYKKNNMLKLIKVEITQYIINDAHCPGIINTVYPSLYYILKEILNDLINDIFWSDKISFDITYSIKAFLKGLYHANFLDSFNKLLDKNLLTDIIFENIKWQLVNDDHNGFLDEMVVFKCNNCNVLNLD